MSPRPPEPVRMRCRAPGCVVVVERSSTDEAVAGWREHYDREHYKPKPPTEGAAHR